MVQNTLAPVWYNTAISQQEMTPEYAEIIGLIKGVQHHGFGQVTITIQEGQITGVDDLKTRRRPVKRG